MNAIDPPHYTSGDIECIDAIRSMLSTEAYEGFLRGSAFKYQWRLGLKGVDNRGLDAAKAQWYLARLQTSIEGAE